jgi:predicted metal-dependent hydrolase
MKRQKKNSSIVSVPSQLFLWGESYSLSFEEDCKPGYRIDKGQRRVTLVTQSKKEVSFSPLFWIHRFYLEQVRIVSRPLLLSWRVKMKAPVKKVHFRKMSSLWGSCSPHNGRVCFNADLARYPEEALEYVVVHEYAHFFVPHHGAEFKALLSQYLPDWKTRKALLQCKKIRSEILAF